MTKNREFFTSESVTEGHPDKMADQISDGILDAILAQDNGARVACETLVTTGLVHVVGEISTKCYVDIPRIIRETVRNIGYTRAKYGFDCDTCGVLVSLDEQSSDIAMGVDEAKEAKEGNKDEFDAIGAGDQGLMFGYATNETEEYMPLPISLAHKLARRLAKVRKEGILTYLRPDGKTQVTIEYEDGKPVHVDTIVISTQHSPEVTRDQIEKDMVDQLDEYSYEEKVKYAAILKILQEDGLTEEMIQKWGRWYKGKQGLLINLSKNVKEEMDDGDVPNFKTLQAFIRISDV